VTGMDGGDREVAELRAEVKAAAAAAQPMFPDTAARLARVAAALEARQEQQDGESG
jgi:hypothetical protein